MSSDGTTRDPRERVQALFSFPSPVNEVSARLVAGGVLVMCIVTIAFGLRWRPWSSPTASWPGC